MELSEIIREQDSLVQFQKEDILDYIDGLQDSYPVHKEELKNKIHELIENMEIVEDYRQTSLVGNMLKFWNKDNPHK